MTSTQPSNLSPSVYSQPHPADNIRHYNNSRKIETAILADCSKRSVLQKIKNGFRSIRRTRSRQETTDCARANSHPASSCASSSIRVEDTKGNSRQTVDRRGGTVSQHQYSLFPITNNASSPPKKSFSSCVDLSTGNKSYCHYMSERKLRSNHMANTQPPGIGLGSRSSFTLVDTTEPRGTLPSHGDGNISQATESDAAPESLPVFSEQLKSNDIANEYCALLPPSPMRPYSDAIETNNATVVGSSSCNILSKGSDIFQNGSDCDHGKPTPVGKWICCRCSARQPIYGYDQGPHLVSILHCACPHRSCDKCTLSGDIKPYKPLEEPHLVSVTNNKHRDVRFGVFCSNCGLSWRAQTVKHTLRRKISVLPKQIRISGPHSQAFERLRKSKSMVNILGEPQHDINLSRSYANMRVLSNEMEKTHGEQAPTALIRFSGFNCTCGHTLHASALSFQVVEPVDTPDTNSGTDSCPKFIEPTFTAKPEDRVRGIGRSILKCSKNGKTIAHPNPLMCNPVTGAELWKLTGNTASMS